MAEQLDFGPVVCKGCLPASPGHTVSLQKKDQEYGWGRRVEGLLLGTEATQHNVWSREQCVDGVKAAAGHHTHI